MRMRRAHAIQIAREMQRIENQKRREPEPQRRGLLARLLGKNEKRSK